MRLLMCAAGRGAGSRRLETAALGLAGRGHEISWWGPISPGAPATIARPHHWRGLGTAGSDLVLASAESVRRAAVIGGLARARGLVGALEHAAVKSWDPIARWAWQSLRGFGLIEPSEADSFRADPAGVDPVRLALWSDDPPPPAPDPAHLDVEILERACERALARLRGQALRAAVFLDRDGTLVREVGYLSDPDQIALLPGVAEGLRSLAAAGHPLIVISNQSGVGRGTFPVAQVHRAMARLREVLRAAGVELDGIYFCPHEPDAGCPCRKPRTFLLERAADDHQLSLRHSFMVGDKEIDVATGHRAGGHGILVRTGYGGDEELRIAAAKGQPPDLVCDDVAAAARWILSHDADTS